MTTVTLEAHTVPTLVLSDTVSDGSFVSEVYARVGMRGGATFLDLALCFVVQTCADRWAGSFQ